MYRQLLQNIFREAHFPVESFGPSHFIPSPEIIQSLRGLPYIDRWKLARSNEWYHVRLEDQSLFLFDEGGRSYTYLQCPLDAPSFREYLAQLDLELNSANRREHAEAYEMVLSTAAPRSHVIPIRFDADRVGYRRGVHPYAHVHIGLENSVRIGVSRSLDATSFVLFVMRQLYPECWHRLLIRQDTALGRLVRFQGSALTEDLWHPLDKVELHLQ